MKSWSGDERAALAAIVVLEGVVEHLGGPDPELVGRLGDPGSIHEEGEPPRCAAADKVVEGLTGGGRQGGSTAKLEELDVVHRRAGGR